jgi:hypothetical protein
VNICECCGHPMPDAYERFGLSPQQLKLFKIVEKAGQAGITYEQLTSKMYGDDPDGGPESRVLTVQRTKMNKRLAMHGLSVEFKRGHYSTWRIVALEKAFT